MVRPPGLDPERAELVAVEPEGVALIVDLRSAGIGGGVRAPFRVTAVMKTAVPGRAKLTSGE